ncbi:hypothetical protein VYU27_002200 [Nannochloropsis oceanica]
MAGRGGERAGESSARSHSSNPTIRRTRSMSIKSTSCGEGVETGAWGVQRDKAKIGRIKMGCALCDPH